MFSTIRLKTVLNVQMEMVHWFVVCVSAQEEGKYTLQYICDYLAKSNSLGEAIFHQN